MKEQKEIQGQMGKDSSQGMRGLAAGKRLILGEEREVIWGFLRLMHSICAALAVPNSATSHSTAVPTPHLENWQGQKAADRRSAHPGSKEA